MRAALRLLALCGLATVFTIPSAALDNDGQPPDTSPITPHGEQGRSQSELSAVTTQRIFYSGTKSNARFAPHWTFDGLQLLGGSFDRCADQQPRLAELVLVYDKTLLNSLGQRWQVSGVIYVYLHILQTERDNLTHKLAAVVMLQGAVVHCSWQSQTSCLKTWTTAGVCIR